jgi:hypothetical protein
MSANLLLPETDGAGGYLVENTKRHNAAFMRRYLV